MAITFANNTYGPTFWGVVYIFHYLGTIDYVCPDTIVVNGTISQIGDTVGVTYNGATYSFTVTAYDSQGAIVLDYAGNLYALSNTALTEGQVLTLTTDGPGDYAPPPCFAAGTRILTRHGEMAVEALAVGDEVVAMHSGGFSPVTWIGRRSIDCSTVHHPAECWPIRVRAHAFAPGRPHRDLFLSPDHAVLVDGVLIPIRYLENTTTIARAARDTITYFHIELARHDVLLAEGLPTETYLDTGNRGDFGQDGSNGAVAQPGVRQATAEQIWADQGCAPLHTSGTLVRTARARLATRATTLGCVPTDDPSLCLRVGGTEHAPVRDGNAWHFALPATTTCARLVSTSFVPATQHPYSIDRRCLGVAVTRLLADGRIIPLHHPALGRGWHRPERGLRWTAGAAELPPLRTLSVLLAPIARRVAA